MAKPTRKAKPRAKPSTTPRPQLPKSPTGIQGLDAITGGGLPTGRPTLVCGGAGCGKTLLAMEFLVRGATDFDEPGVFMTFEENAQELSDNVASIGFDLPSLIRRKKLILDYVHLERSEIAETGEFNLEGIFIRLGHAIDSIGAKRVVLDTIESLFSALPNPTILRAEIRRLFRWLKDKGVTAIVTGERGAETLTRQGLEEYVSDCVIMLDNRLRDQVCLRRLRVVKYRGSTHGTNEYPFLIDEDGIAVMPITSIGLSQDVSTQRVSSGVERLDTMLSGKGYYRGSSVLVSGTAGTGKSSLGAAFVDSACRRGERAIIFAFEESPKQTIRNMRSIGIDLQQWVQRGLLEFHCSRPTMYNLENHLSLMLKAINTFKPQVVVVDPLNTFVSGDNEIDVKSLLMRLIDVLKLHQITGLFTSLTAAGTSLEHTDVSISSLMDTWLLLRDIEYGGERSRGMYVLKSRGMAHSKQIREFMLTDHGVQLRDVYVGPAGVLTGTARSNQEAAEKAEELVLKHQMELGEQELVTRRQVLESKIAAMRADFALQEIASLKVTEEQHALAALATRQRAQMGVLRGGGEATKLATPHRANSRKSK
jgi:circadian clock protein KaiC